MKLNSLKIFHMNLSIFGNVNKNLKKKLNKDIF